MKKVLFIAVIALTAFSSCRKCNEGPTDGDVCMDIYDPVCANGVTYGNECEAKRAGAREWTKGECNVK